MSFLPVRLPLLYGILSDNLLHAAVQYIPEWFPGSGFKKTARLYKDTVTELVDRPFVFVKTQMVSYLALTLLLQIGNILIISLTGTWSC